MLARSVVVRIVPLRFLEETNIFEKITFYSMEAKVEYEVIITICYKSTMMQKRLSFLLPHTMNQENDNYTMLKLSNDSGIRKPELIYVEKTQCGY